MIELRLLRILGPGQNDQRPEQTRFLAGVPEYRFAIHRLEDSLRVGRIHLRVTSDRHITETIGHSGYAIDEAHRRKGYATRAVRLIAGLSRYWEVLPLWILIEPDNTASCKTVERVGFELIDEIDSPEELVSLGIGSIVRRYRYQPT